MNYNYVNNKYINIVAMGIRNLNKYLLNCCKTSIKNIHLSHLKNKKIAVDISIYMYHFERNGILIEGINEMINIFKHYNIIPLFVFDGKPPDEKRNVLDKRKKEKEQKKEQLDDLTKIINEDETTETEKVYLLNKIKNIKKQIVSINQTKIQQIKHIIQSNNYIYYDAPQEADELCAMMVYKKHAWACMSEDMDMFVYGCPKIIRYFNIHKSTVKIYNIYHILHELKITLHDFKQICILSGTDYNSTNSKFNLNDVLQLYDDYLKNNCKKYPFSEWVYANIDASLDIKLLYKIYSMFDLKHPSKTQLTVGSHIF